MNRVRVKLRLLCLRAFVFWKRKSRAALSLIISAAFKMNIDDIEIRLITYNV